jgi:hypothetical protein
VVAARRQLSPRYTMIGYLQSEWIRRTDLCLVDDRLKHVTRIDVVSSRAVFEKVQHDAHPSIEVVCCPKLEDLRAASQHSCLTRCLTRCRRHRCPR